MKSVGGWAYGRVILGCDLSTDRERKRKRKRGKDRAASFLPNRSAILMLQEAAPGSVNDDCARFSTLVQVLVVVSAAELYSTYC